MNSRHKRFTIGTSVLVIFSIAQVYIGASFAGSDPPARRARVVTQSVTGILVTSGRQGVLVNGTNAVTDATIMSGASIESPPGVSATVNLGRLGRLDIAPDTSLKLDFSTNRIAVTLFKGCVILHTKRMTTGTIATQNGVIGTTDPSKDDVLDVCQREGAAAPLVNQGAAANAGAGASGAGSATAAGATAGGLSPALSAIIAASLIGPMTVAAIVLNCHRGTNPSPELNTKCF